MTSYPAAKKTGTRIGYRAIVSSASPNVVPPAAIIIVIRTIRMYSFPFVIFDRTAIAELNAPI